MTWVMDASMRDDAPPVMTLEGLRVLDLGQRTSTAWCARLMGDYGAEVIGVEATPHPLRETAPFTENAESVPATWMLSGRALAEPGSVGALIRTADIILTDCHRADWHADELARRNPEAIICALTAYGLTGPLAGTPGNDLTVCAEGGWAAINGLADRTPLKCSSFGASCQAGTFAFGTVITTIIEQLAHSTPGQVIDIAERDILVSTSAPAPLRYQYSGFRWSRKPAVDVNEGPIPVSDGWFALTLSRPAFWIKAMELLGLPDLAADTELQQPGLRPKLKERFVDRVGKAMASWQRMDLFRALGERHVIAGPVLDMAELSTNEQFLARGFFRKNPEGIRFPGPFAHMARTRWRAPSTSARTQHSFDSTNRIATRPVRSAKQGTGPLAGIRGLVLTQAWAGTYCTELLALLGADVIQLETRGRLDSWRGTYQNPIPKSLQDRASAKHAWNCSPLYNSVNLNKRCITVDLAEPEGVEIFKGLIRDVDFVAENFSPRVMAKLGIGYDTLCEIRPDLIMASLSAYGAKGPWSHVPGIGGTIEPSSGMSSLLGYEGEHPMNSGQMYPDPVAGLCGFSALALAILHRDRTGEGQYIDLSMQEANFVFVGDAFMEYELTGNVRGPLGNSHPNHAPHDIFPTEGDDEWIAISAGTLEEWRALASVLELPEHDAPDSAEGRHADRQRLNKLISERTRLWNKHALTTRLRDAGVMAAPVLAPDEIAQDRNLRARGHMVSVTHPEAGPAWQSVLPARFSRSQLPAPVHAPLQGEHSFEVFETFLDMDRPTYEALAERGVTGSGPSSKASVANQA